MNRSHTLNSVRTVIYHDALRQLLKRLNLYERGRRLLWLVFTGMTAVYNWEDEFDALGTAVRYRVRTADDVFQSYLNLPSERPIVVDVLERLEDDDVVFDVGGGTGITACLLANAYPDADIYAFEPNPSRIERFRENIRLNDCNVDVVPVALSNVRSPGAVRGDELVERGVAPTPNVVKIDVDGHELAVVEGLLGTLGNEDCRLVYCELHPFAFPDFESAKRRLIGALVDRGFDVEQIHQRTDQPFIRAMRNW